MATGFARSLRTVLWGGDDGRVRSLWRILVPLAAFTLVVPSVLALLVRLFGHEPTVGRASRTVAYLLGMGVVVALSTRWLNRRSLRAYGFDLDRRWWRDLAGGVAVGVLVPGLAAAGHVALGWASVQEVVSPGAGSFAVGMVLTLTLFLVVGLAEEFLFRGVILLNAIEGIGARVTSPGTAVALAWLGASLLFGVFHVPNALATGGEAVAVYLVSVTITGLALGLAYLLTGSLAFPVGLHVAMNVATSAVFGSSTGQTAYPALIRLQVEFPGIWHELHGLELLSSSAYLLFVVGWISLTRERFAVDGSLLGAADR